MPLELDVHNPAHVAGHSVLRADLGADGRTLVVLSGIARPELGVDDDEEDHRATCRLLLREPTEHVDQSTACVGLASIDNDDSAFLFATDEAVVDANGPELALIVPLALRGDDSHLHRFSYQVVLTQRRVPTGITGTLSWPASAFTPAAAEPSAVSGTFSVTANALTVTTTSAGGVFGSGTVEQLTPIAGGRITSVQRDGDTWHAAYRIDDVPKAQDLRVTAGQRGLPGVLQFAPTPAGVDLVRLTAAEPVRAGVDFRLVRTTPVA